MEYGSVTVTVIKCRWSSRSYAMGIVTLVLLTHDRRTCDDEDSLDRW